MNSTNSLQLNQKVSACEMTSPHRVTACCGIAFSPMYELTFVKANCLEPMRGRINHPYLISGCVGLALLPRLHTRQLCEFSRDSSATRVLKSILVFKLCSLYFALKCMSVFDPTGTYSSRDVCCTLVSTSGTTLYVLLYFSLDSPVTM